jgi:predicted DNA-binding transcriptional regulator AlpA
MAMTVFDSLLVGPNMTNNTDKEFLKISDMVAKLGVTRTQFWKMRKAGEVPPPVIKNPQMWLATKVMEFYENRASRE